MHPRSMQPVTAPLTARQPPVLEVAAPAGDPCELLAHGLGFAGRRPRLLELGLDAYELFHERMSMASSWSHAPYAAINLACARRSARLV